MNTVVYNATAKLVVRSTVEANTFRKEVVVPARVTDKRIVTKLATFDREGKRVDAYEHRARSYSHVLIGVWMETGETVYEAPREHRAGEAQERTGGTSDTPDG